jgi:glycosyltransferase involved in cell wall biosynthesis
MGGKEYWCALKNCRSNIWESVAYALRSAVARKLRYFHKNVTLFIALTKFAREHLVQAGFEGDRIFVLPNMVAVEDSPTDPFQGRYVAFAGRMSPEKGVDTLLAAGRLLPDIPVCLAGDGPMMPAVVKQVSPNATFLGRLDTQEMTAFYRSARFLVIPSRCFEMCPLVVGEAMSHGLPVIASRIGGLPELVENNVTGFLFEPGNSEDLARKVRLLWDNPDLCRKMGQAGREKAIREYNKDVYYRRLMAVYERAIEVNREQSSSGAVK